MYSRKSKKIQIVCLTCNKEVYKFKKNKFVLPLWNNAQGKFDHLGDKLREDKFILPKLDLQQDVFAAYNKLNDAAVYASFSLLQIIAE